jgi:EAL domain-containing protein (putative c-di-GMP-specific phosphodiesterase class I)
MHIDVVAEGVETEQQALELSALGCRFVQGYLLGKPLEAVRVIELLGAQGAA